MQERYIEHEDRLLNMYKFITVICIEGGCGYDFKLISYRIMHGQYNLTEAIDEWLRLGHVLISEEYTHYKEWDKENVNG